MVGGCTRFGALSEQLLPMRHEDGESGLRWGGLSGVGKG